MPGYVNVLGDATNTASVSVNTNMAYRKDRYFRAELGVNNSANPIWLGITNVAVMPNGASSYVVSNVTGHDFVPKTPESFGYDLDGNLTNDGRWSLTWDAENRLVNMTSLSTGPAGSKLKLDFSYDHQGRRMEKVVSTWNGSSYVSPSTNQFVYDVWNLLAELGASHSALRTYLWGLDLSGSERGAGGVGGLLVVYDSSTINSQPSTHFACYDGNGNVTALVKATDGTASANYEYGPFGELVRATGLMAKANPFRFSTKYQDDESDLLYYGYRSYNPTLGRWLSRDPIEEKGGENVYGLVGNDAVNDYDALGLFPGVPDTSGNFHPIAALAITKLEVAMRDYEVGKVTGLLGALAKLKGAIPSIKRVTIDPKYVSKGATADYVPLLNWMRLKGSNPDGLDVTHETVHAYNKLVSGLSNNDRVDEGMAYTTEQTYTALSKFKVIEDMLKEGCESNRQRIAGRWATLWRRYASPGHFPGGSLNDRKSSPFKLTGKDFANVNTHFGLKFSCGALANAFTQLASKGGCCMFFTCDAYPSSPYSVPAGVQIDAAFE